MIEGRRSLDISGGKLDEEDFLKQPKRSSFATLGLCEWLMTVVKLVYLFGPKPPVNDPIEGL